jgi:gamma-D-glutamyl-L-lysine dipeptidyl-peptidase
MRSAVLLCAAMALSAFAETSPAVINRPVVNMFSKPSADASVVSQAIFGTNVQVLEDQPQWLKIRTPDDYTGWIEAGGAVKRDVYAVVGSVASVNNLFGSLYRETSITKHPPIFTLPFEARMEVLAEPEAEERRWIKVRLPDMREAWIQRGDVSLNAKQITREEMLAISKRFAGLPYFWGGTSTYGYDCSGFTQMLYRQTGVTLPRDAMPQAEWSGVKAIAQDELQPGDLLFFGESEEKITHTGMYIGNGEFIHATAHDRPVIQVSKLADPHWTKLLVATRRVK